MGVASLLALMARDWSANGIAHSKNAHQARQHAGALGWRLTPEETSRAGNGDVDTTPVLHQALREKAMLPREHLTDSNYAEAKQFLDSRLEYGIDLIAPTRSDTKWQAEEQQGFDASRFQDQRDNQAIKIKFSMKDCNKCALKQICATAINLLRFLAWNAQRSLARTRASHFAALEA